MKILLGLIAIIISTYVGYIASSKHVKKKKFYDSFNEFNKRLINEVAFSQKSLIDILNEFDNQSDFYLIFSRFFYKQKFELNMNYLSNDDKIFIKIIPHMQKNSVTNEFWNTNENIPNLLQNRNTKPPSSIHKVFHLST